MAKKDVDQTAKRLRRQGWTVERTSNGRQRAVNPENGAVATMPTTPSEYRGHANMQAQLRKAGWDPTRPDPERLKRRQAAQEAAQRQDEATAVLEALQRSPRALSPSQLAEQTGLDRGQVAGALQYLSSRHPELDREGDSYAWDPPVSAYEVWQQRKANVRTLPPLVASEDQVVLFESVEIRPAQGVVLRDETGQLWLATPISEADLATG